MIISKLTVTEFVLVIPWPAPSLFVNRSNGRHWAVRFNDKVAAREAAHLEAIGHYVGDPRNDHQVDIIIAPPDNRQHNVDGVLSALKPTLDGIAKGLGIDDERFNPFTLRRIAPVAGGRITIVVHDDLPF